MSRTFRTFGLVAAFTTAIAIGCATIFLAWAVGEAGLTGLARRQTYVDLYDALEHGVFLVMGIPILLLIAGALAATVFLSFGAFTLLGALLGLAVGLVVGRLVGGEAVAMAPVVAGLVSGTLTLGSYRLLDRTHGAGAS